jgi:hypothetical protein
MDREAMKQPEALLLADILQHKIPSIECLEKAAAELRRLHEVNQDLLKALHEALETEREWVGLTDDDVFELADTNLYDGGKNYGVLAFAKAIEQALKEKNHG